jgi:nucleotide-binding universal stress UspA family protein
MLRQILVPLDGSELSEQALTYAQNVIAPNGRIILLSVIEVPVDYDYSLMDIPLTMVTARAYDEAEFNKTYRRVYDYLLDKSRSLTAAGFEVECVVETGVPADVIVAVAEKHKAHAIVMTTHGRTGFSRWLFGSVTQKVISLLPCPVMVVPGTEVERKPEPVPAKAAVAK